MAVIKYGRSICSDDRSLEKRGIFKKTKLVTLLSVFKCESDRKKGDGVKEMK